MPNSIDEIALSRIGEAEGKNIVDPIPEQSKEA
jgi:hypothetical protein